MSEARKILKVLMVALCVGALIWQCSMALAAEPRYEFIEVDTTQYKTPPPWRIGFANASISNAWRVFFFQEIKQEFARFPEVELLVTDAMDSPSKQVSDVEDLVARGIDLLLISPCTAKPLTPIVERVMDMGIPVVVVDRGIDSDKYISFVHSSHYEMGKAQATWLVEQLGGKGNVVLLGGIAGATPAEERIDGAMFVFNQYPDIKVLATRYCDWSPVKGKREMADLLVRFPRIDGVWSGSALQGSGAVEAFVDARIPVPPITGEDMNRFFKQWKTMRLTAVAVSNPVWQGAIAARICISILQGVPVSHYIDVGRTIITERELDKYLDAEAPDDWFMDNYLRKEWLP
ncbi:ABC transporter substrate-binding protein [Candidatus Aerophobetes bacterium]|nr:ABC transporter substrate-binding protein [Candidatus Aerophobetes bacterium]